MTTDYDSREVDDDTALVMMSTQARDPNDVQRLMRKHGVTNALDLLPLLPNRYRRVSRRDRLIRWLARFEGGYEHEPTVAPYIRRLKQRKEL